MSRWSLILILASWRFEQKFISPTPAKKILLHTGMRDSLSCLQQNLPRDPQPILVGVGDWNKSQQLQLPPKRESIYLHMSLSQGPKKGILALCSCHLLHLILAGVGDWNKSQQLQLPPKRESIYLHMSQRPKKGILALSSCHLLHLILAGVGDWNKSSHLRLPPKR